MLKSKKAKTFFSILSLALGSGLIFSSTNDYISVGADTLKNSGGGTIMLMVLFIVGIALIAIGVMTAVFVFVSKSDGY